jgi:hypothetical protein
LSLGAGESCTDASGQPQAAAPAPAYTPAAASATAHAQNRTRHSFAGTRVARFPLDDVYLDVEQVDGLAADGGVGFLERYACLGRQGPEPGRKAGSGEVLAAQA